MKSIETTCLGVKFKVTGAPETVGELLELGTKAGLSEQQLLDKIIGYFVAHNVNEDGRTVIRDIGPDGLGVSFKTTTSTKDGVTTEVDDETIGVWAKRAQAEKGVDSAGLAALLQPLIDKAVVLKEDGQPETDKAGNQIPLNVLEFSVGGARKGGSGANKIGKEALAQATASILAGTSEQVVGLLTARHADLVFARYDKDTVLKDAAQKEQTVPAGTVTAESLATAIRTNKLRREQEAAKADAVNAALATTAVAA